MTKLRVSFVFVFCVILLLGVAYADCSDFSDSGYDMVSYLDDDLIPCYDFAWKYYGFSSNLEYLDLISSLKSSDAHTMEEVAVVLASGDYDFISPRDALFLSEAAMADGGIVTLATSGIEMTLIGYAPVGSYNCTYTINYSDSSTGSRSVVFSGGRVDAILQTTSGFAYVSKATYDAAAAAAAASPWTAANVSSLLNNLSGYNSTTNGDGTLYYLFVNGLTYSGNILSSTGLISNASKISLTGLLSNGIQGLGRFLMGTSGSYSFNYWGNGQTTPITSTGTSIGQLLSNIANAYFGTHYIGENGYVLGQNGQNFNYGGRVNDLIVVRDGFIGLATLLRGPSGSSYTASLFEFGDEESSLTKTESEKSYSNILEVLVDMYSGLQRPLSQLQAVLANDDELELRQQTEPEVDAVIDGFTGEGQGAPSVDQIGEMAGVSGQMGDLFDSGVTPSDLFNAATSVDSYSFFTQEVANALDTTGAISTYSSDDQLGDLSDYELTEDGFYVLRDQSFFDLWQYIGRSDK